MAITPANRERAATTANLAALGSRKRTFELLPDLKTEEDFSGWDVRLRANLEPYELLQYIEKAIPVPEDKRSTEYAIWLQDRHDVGKLIMASIKDRSLWYRVAKRSWGNVYGLEPHAAYVEIVEALQPNRLKAEVIGKLGRYLARVKGLRSRLICLGIDNDPTVELWTVLCAIESSSPELYHRNSVKMEDRSLTWDALIADMADEATSE
ncbi:hypothetical protein VTK56DRAFT_8159 [Thermocarpiscus australiensis]